MANPAPPAGDDAAAPAAAGDGPDAPPVDAAAALAALPEAVAVVDADRRVLWGNARLAALAGRPCVGEDLFGALAADLDAVPPKNGGPLAAADGRHLTVSASDLPGGRTAVVVRDVTAEVTHRQKLDAIRQAGVELGDLSPEEVPEMSAADRVELLRGKVIRFTRDLMEFDTVEIRLLDETTGQLRPLLSVGMAEGVPELPLVASEADNGATGLVAATGEPYLCHDTAADPHYLPGAPNAKSALTVPLVLGEQVLGTFNVESERPAAFDEDDLRFAELFAREVAAALHTLELLVAEKYATARESTERTLREVADPLDEILQDAAWLLERYIGHGREMSDRLKRITARGREIKSLIHRVGEDLRPEPTRTPLPAGPSRPALRGARVLVADGDPHVRAAAHALLGRMGCEVETVHDAAEALTMARTYPYDAALVDIRLPPGPAGGSGGDAPDDESDGEPRGGGYACFAALREHAPGLPVIFMTGFGYDPAHSIVNARREGLHGVLYKPFRPEQLLGEVETAVATAE